MRPGTSHTAQNVVRPRHAADVRILHCTNGHEHVVGLMQVPVLVGTKCPWCAGLIGIEEEGDSQ